MNVYRTKRMMSNSEISDSGGIDRNSIDDDDSIRDALPVQTDSSSDESSSDDEKIILNTTPVLQPVVNTVLSFCSYGIDVGTIVNVKKSLLKHFRLKKFPRLIPFYTISARMILLVRNVIAGKRIPAFLMYWRGFKI